MIKGKHKTENQTPVVYLGGNHYTALGGIRTLGRRGVPVYALDYDLKTAYALSSRYVKEKVPCPRFSDSEEKLVDFLLDFSSRFKEKPVLMASHDAYAILMSRYGERLSEKYIFHQNKPGLIADLVDKKKLYNLSVRHNLSMPSTFFLSSDEKDKEITEKIKYPCIVKPALSHRFTKIFRRKCFFADNKQELGEILKKVKGKGMEIMVQEVIPGFDDHMFLLDVFINKEGEATHVVTAQKLRQFPINFGASSFVRQKYVPEIIEPGINFLQNIGYKGFCEIEFKQHAENKQYYMIEVNARLTSFTSLLDNCGMEAAYLIYLDLINKPASPMRLQEDTGKAFYHFFEDAIASYNYLRSGQLGIKDILKPIFQHKKTHAVWALDDPRPLFSFFWLKAKKIPAKIFKK